VEKQQPTRLLSLSCTIIRPTSTVEISTVVLRLLACWSQAIWSSSGYINHWFSLRDRHPRQNDTAKNQERFVGVSDCWKSKPTHSRIPSQPIAGFGCESEVQMTDNEDDVTALDNDVLFWLACLCSFAYGALQIWILLLLLLLLFCKSLEVQVAHAIKYVISDHYCVIFTARHDSLPCTSYIKSVCLSVCPSVCHMLALCQNDSCYNHSASTAG